MSQVESRRFRFSIRSLMYAVALSALVLAPLAILVRRTELQRYLALRASREAERARALGQAARAEALRRANAARIQAASGAQGTSAVASSAPAPDMAPEVARSAGLWAALRVNHPVFREGETGDLDIEFSLVNDGEEVVDPGLGESRIVINGKALEESGLIMAGGPREDRFSALPPGDHLRFAYGLGDYFKEPGVYRVSWQGAGFRSPDAVFRVLRATPAPGRQGPNRDRQP